MIIFHITTPELWEIALNRGVYTHPSLKTEGFIHCSPIELLLESANLHFSSEDSDELIVLHIPDKKVKHILKWEKTRNETEFPHIYGSIPLEIISDISILVRNEQNEWTFHDM